VNDLRPWGLYQILAVLDTGRGETALVGHTVRVVRQLPGRAPGAPYTHRRIEIFYGGALYEISARVRRADPDGPCRCPLHPFPHRRSPRCLASPRQSHPTSSK
jgi:hypothetical protein